MRSWISVPVVMSVGLLAGAGLMLAGCQTQGPTPVASAPQAPAAIPPQPRPPLGTSASYTPPALKNGVRQTVNADISSVQALWNLRSAYNVAALNCVDGRYAPILSGYKTFLKQHAKKLSATNTAVDAIFTASHGKKTGLSVRDAYMTRVYNYYAFPPTMKQFCETMLGVAAELNGKQSGDLEAYASGAIPRIDGVFHQFFDSFEQYQRDLDAWRTRYANDVAIAAR